MRSRRALAAFCAAAVLAAACQGPVDPSDNVTTEFSGVLEPASQNDHFKSLTRYGEFTLRVKSLSPSEGTHVFVIFGIVQGGLCSILAQRFVGHDELAAAGEAQPADYCIQVLDLDGSLTEPVEYVLEFSHPPV